jgi:hypothetical protein
MSSDLPKLYLARRGVTRAPRDRLSAFGIPLARPRLTRGHGHCC